MGMFDWVSCDYPLPLAFSSKTMVFQTKDLDNMMDSLWITEDGRLMRETRAWTPPPPDYWEDLEFHGILNFYTAGDDGNWYEYKAKFTDGQLVEITGGLEERSGKAAQS